MTDVGQAKKSDRESEAAGGRKRGGRHLLRAQQKVFHGRKPGASIFYRAGIGSQPTVHGAPSWTKAVAIRFRTAVAQCAEWRAAGLDLEISINISARNLTDPGLVSHMENTADTFRVPPERITIELTEGVFIDISQKATTVIHRMYEKGFRISIDDYGTGYSSLSYIKGLPVAELKIDQCFVRGIMESRNDAMIVRSTIDMARRLGMSVVAEGIEDAGIVAQLHGFGCAVGQGYHFGRPMPGRAFLAWAEAACREARGAA